MDNINMKTIKFNKDKTVLLNMFGSKRILTRIISLKGGNWNECVKTEDSNGKITRTPIYPIFYKIGDFYYV